MKAQKTEHCMVCGSRLEYLNNAEELICTYCSKSASGHVKCPEGHFVCDACHGSGAMTMIQEAVLTTVSKNPFALAELMMNHPALPMLGCEHAFIAAGALLAALRNSPYGRIGDPEIREAFTRIEQQAKSGYCGLTGVCGIAPAIGACFSLFLQARCGSDREQKMVMEAVIRVQAAIARLTGPSCCKAYVRASLDEAVSIFAERFGMALPGPSSPVICRHQSKHPHGCREEQCPYYRKEKNSYEESIHLKTTVCHS
jgi:hypothetical protein